MEGNERMGILDVHSSPIKVTVYVDHSDYGKTPIRIPLIEGEHLVEIYNGGKYLSQKVYVRRGETSYINTKLIGDNSQQVHSTGKIFGQSSHNLSGIIDIQCVPVRVSVWIDNHHLGTTPLKASVKEGIHKVYLSSVGKNQTFSVIVRRGEIAYVKGNLLSVSNKQSTTFISNTRKPKVNFRCLWITIISVIIAIVIGWWIYSHYFGGTFSSTCLHHGVKDIVAVNKLVELIKIK